MNRCEDCQVQISALLDLEIDPAEVIEALDHAMECDACRDFYREARAMDRATRPVDTVRRAGISPAQISAVMPPGVWERIERAGRRHEPVSFRDWGLRVAALVVVALGLWNLGGLRNAPSTPPTRSYDLSLEEAGSEMTEARFVEMTAELMRSNRRYHRAMFEVMKDITRATQSEEGSDEVVATESEDRDQSTTGEPYPRLPG